MTVIVVDPAPWIETIFPEIVATAVFELLYENAPVEFVLGSTSVNVAPGEYVCVGAENPVMVGLAGLIYVVNVVLPAP